MFLLIHSFAPSAQSKTTIDQAVEGGKVLVELIKVFSGDRDKEETTGCRGRHADLCIVNARDTSLTVIVTQRTSLDTRELVITKGNQECSLQLAIGVWTYDIKLGGSLHSIRKGDLLIEGCNNLTMTIK